MNELTAAIVYTLLAGLMIPAGGFLASIEHIRPRWMETEFRHSVVAFGGGVLVAATALVLVPEGAENLPAITALGAFIAGGIVFAIAEKMNGGGSKAQLWAMLTDFVPEAAALGAMIAVGKPEAGLLALLIGMQNLPEGFNAYREMKHVRGRKLSVRTLMLFLALSLLGPAAGLSGYFLLADKPEITSGVMLAAGGGILYLMFQDIAPKAHLENRTGPSLAALGGFAFGLAGHLLLA